MKKGFRNAVSILLVVFMVTMLLLPPGLAEAGENIRSATIPLKFTGIEGNTNATNLSLTTNIDFASVYGWPIWGFNKVFTKSAELMVNGSEKASMIYFLYGNVMFFESALSGTSTPASVKIAAGTTFTCDGKTFEVSEDFEARNDGSGWKVYQEPSTKVNISGVHWIEVFGEGSDLPGLTEMYFTTDQSWNEDTTSIPSNSQKIKIDAGEQSVDSYRLDGGGKLRVLHWGGASMKKDTIVTIPAGTKLKVGTVTYELEKEFAFKYDGANSGTKYEEGQVTPSPKPESSTKFNITGVHWILVIGEGNALNGLTEMYFTTDQSWNENTTPVAANSQKVKIGAAEQSVDSYRLDAGGKLRVLHWSGASMKKDAIVTIPAGTKLKAGTVTYELEKEFAFKYDGANSGTKYEEGQVTPPPSTDDYTYQDIQVKNIFVQGGTAVYLTTSLTKPHDYSGKVFNTSDVIVYKRAGGEEKLSVVQVHEDAATDPLYLLLIYQAGEGDGISIKTNGTAVNPSEQTGLRFTTGLNLFYTNGKWVVDNDAPVILCRGEEVTADMKVGLRVGMTEEEVKALFSANDAIQGVKDVVFTCPDNMFKDGKMQAGVFDVTVSAKDNSGNAVEYTIHASSYSKDAPIITYEGAAERMFDAGEKFDVSSLNASAKDGNGSALEILYSYSDGALDSAGAMNKGAHKLYLTVTDDEGQSFTRAIILNCYQLTNLKVTGFFYFLNNDLFISTNIKDPDPLNGITLTTDGLLINDEPGVISWTTMDANSGSLYIMYEKHAGDTMKIAAGSTFVNREKYVGVRVKNSFMAHTDGIGWIVDRVQKSGGTSTGSTSPKTGDGSMHEVPILCVCLMTATFGMFVCQKNRRKRYE